MFLPGISGLPKPWLAQPLCPLGHPLRTRSVTSFVPKGKTEAKLRLGGFPLNPPRCLVCEIVKMPSPYVRMLAASTTNPDLDGDPNDDMVNARLAAVGEYADERGAANAWHATCRGCGGSGEDEAADGTPCFYCRGDGRFDVFSARDQEMLEHLLADDRLWSIVEVRDEPRHNNGDRYFLAYVRSSLSNNLPTAPHPDMPNVAGAADARVGHTVPPILGGWNGRPK